MTTLVVFVRPISRSTENWDALVERFRADLASGSADVRDADYLALPADASKAPGILSVGRGLEEYARQVAASIDQADRVHRERSGDGRGYDDIILSGHSLGGVVVRHAWLHASGVWDRSARQDWSDRVSRIVLAASLNRGFNTKRGRSPKRRVTRLAITLLGWMAPFTWKDLLAGSDFMANLRLSWIGHMASLERTNADRVPRVVQVLGGEDDYVTREDSRDVEQFRGATHLDMSNAHHGDILDSTDEGRYLKLRDAFWSDDLPTTDPEPLADPSTTDVVLVVHGIRAGTHGWPEKLREIVNARGPGWAAFTPTYNYFSAAAFAWPMTRRRKARWFIDQYTQEFVRHPDARFHFAGHSNGTYVLGRALAKVPAIRMHNVYLASSVLPHDFEWSELKTAERIGAVRADRGSRDIPVGLLSRGLSFMGDIGGAGVTGFEDLTTGAAWTFQFGPFPGGHSAPVGDKDLQEQQLEGISDFLASGSSDKPDGLLPEVPPPFALLSRVAPVLVPVVLVAALGAVVWAWLALGLLWPAVLLLVGLALLFVA